MAFRFLNKINKLRGSSIYPKQLNQNSSISFHQFSLLYSIKYVTKLYDTRNMISNPTLYFEDIINKNIYKKYLIFFAFYMIAQLNSYAAQEDFNISNQKNSMYLKQSIIYI
jgi:hypothetical protein